MIQQKFYFCQNQIIKDMYKRLDRAMPKVDKDERYFYNVVFLDAWPISMGALKIISPEEYELIDIMVIPGFQKNNVGSYTFKFLETRVRVMGGRKINVNSPAKLIHFFENLGFVRTEDKYNKKSCKNYMKMSKIVVKTRYKH